MGECVIWTSHHAHEVELVTGRLWFVYYESIKRELNKRLIFECRCDARLKAKAEGCTRLAYTMWREEP